MENKEWQKVNELIEKIKKVQQENIKFVQQQTPHGWF